jgi:hypothetical protein
MSLEPHAFKPDAISDGKTCEHCGRLLNAEVHFVQRPTHQYCINCLMTQGKARKLEYSGDAWECVTIGGCSGRFTASYLNRVSEQVNKMMIAFGIQAGKIIVKGTATERNYQAEVTGERRVILPNDDE